MAERIGEALDGHLAVVGRQHEALLEGGQRREAVDRLGALGVEAHRFEQPLEVGRRLALHRSRPPVQAHGEHLAKDRANRPLLAGAEQVGEVADRQARGVEPVEQLEGALPVGQVEAEQVRVHHAHHRREGRDVVHHRHRAVLGVQRQGEAPFLDEAVDRRALRRPDPVLVDAAGPRLGDHGGIEGIEDHLAVVADEIGVGDGRRFRDAVGVVQEHAHVADAPDAGVRAGRRLPRLQAREAQDALLRLAGVPVVVDLLVGAGGHAHAPGAAAVLVDQHHAVLLALVDRAGGAGRHAGRVQAVVADAGEVVEDDALQLLELPPRLLGHPRQRRVVAGVDARSAEVVVPGRPALDVDGLPGDRRDGNRGGLVVGGRRVEQVGVTEGERLVVVLDVGQRRVVEQLEQRAETPVQLEPQGAVLGFPAAAQALLVLPPGRVAGAGPRLDVVPPHVLGALAVGPQVLAGDRAGVAADALVEVEQHADLGLDVHRWSPVPARIPASRSGGRRRRCPG